MMIVRSCQSNKSHDEITVCISEINPQNRYFYRRLRHCGFSANLKQSWKPLSEISDYRIASKGTRENIAEHK